MPPEAVETETTVGEGAAAGTTQQSTETQETKTGESERPTVTKDGEQPEVTDNEVDIPGLEKTEEGFILKIDPEDPNSSYYTGKTPEEVFEKWRKGTAEKDRTIREARVKEKVSGTVPRQEIEPEAPDERDILLRICKERKVDPKFLSMTDEQWIEWADEKKLRDFQISKYQNLVETIRNDASTEYSTKNLEYVNTNTVVEEADQVTEMIVDGKVVDEFDNEAVLDRVMKNPDNFSKTGRLKSGVYTKEAAKEIMRLSKGKTKTAITKQLEDDIARGNEAKDKVRSAGAGKGGGGSSITKPEPKAPKSYEDGIQEILREQAAKAAQGSRK